MLADWDLALRFVVVGVLTLLLLMVLTGAVRRPLRLALAGLLIGAGNYVLNASTLVQRGTPLQQWVDLAALFTPFFAWLAALHLFERPPQPRVVLLAAAALIGGWATGFFLRPTDRAGFYIIHIVDLLLIADLLRNAIVGRADDLVEKRRSVRLWLPVLVALQTGLVLAFELLTARSSGFYDPRIELGNVVLILALVLFAGRTLLQTDPELLLASEAEPEPAASSTALSPSEAVLRDKLDAAMAEQVYRTPGLTIAQLAEHLATPEHRLRALINRRLGHRNFAAFLNRYRIDEACIVLADRERVDLPILSIAMDLGYNSLPTFNRAFRAATDQTPSDYRRAAIGQK